MSIRWKFALAVAALSALAAIAASALGYSETRSQLYGQIDSSVRQGADRLAHVAAVRSGADQPARGLPFGPGPGAEFAPQGFPNHPPRGAEEGPIGDPVANQALLVQRLGKTGAIKKSQTLPLPVDAADRQQALGGSGETNIRDATVQGTTVRLATAPILGGGAIQVARSTAEAAGTLNSLRDQLALLTLAIVALAALAGFLLAKRATDSLEHLTESAERVASTGSPDEQISVEGTDEIGRLAGAFSQMLASLAESREQQQRLVQDAGHELRTPLTSLTTNLTLLDRLSELSPQDQADMISDLRSEAGEMTSLVNELVELTTGGGDEPVAEVHLATVARKAAEQTTRRTGRAVSVDAQDTVLLGQARSLQRAIGNLLDNAAKFDDSLDPLTLTVAQDRVEVADRGPGIPAGQETLIFQRFHRAVEARNVPGSGLGLAIVHDVAKRHGGVAYAHMRKGGGAVVGFTFSSRNPLDRSTV
ncbi:MAG: HAMP domain-containing protein [Actinobacteria bacterium]|uniref:histidine kinase n=1 Tax=freshwater metagenome TaxID=449393 RepID=A0A6J7DNX6_9ZZZZ|nr:HAMP domain-containing protein [Actinomycetota bacterium]